MNNQEAIKKDAEATKLIAQALREHLVTDHGLSTDDKKVVDLDSAISKIDEISTAYNA